MTDRNKKHDAIIQCLENIYETLEGQYTTMTDKTNLNENVLTHIEHDMDDLTHRFAAARRGLSLVNKLKPGPSKLKNTKRVMSNLSRIRTAISDIEKKVADFLYR